MRKWIACLLALLCMTACALPTWAEAPPAQPDAASQAASILHVQTEPTDPTLRVWLQSLGARQALGLTLEGAYATDGAPAMQFASGTEIKLGLANGRIALQVGGAVIDMGEGFTLQRRAAADSSLGGAYIHESERDTLYAGDLAVDIADGNLRVIVTLHIEDYLYGVVPYEMADFFPVEALKAQAVAARTYAMQRRARYADRAYHVADTANDQVYKGLEPRYDRPILAVNETRGVVGMTADGAYAECFYSASNGGQTALATDVWGSGTFDYLDIRDDPYDLENPDSIVRTAIVPRDIATLPPELFSLLLNSVGEQLLAAGTISPGDAVGLVSVENVEAVDPVYGGASRQYGTVRFTLRPKVQRLGEPDAEGMRAHGPEQTLEEPVTVDLSFYDQVRSLLNIAINSSRYELVTVDAVESGFAVTARRFGHGVGLSQRGAEWMAKQYAKTYLEILGFYYPGLDLVQLTWADITQTPAQAQPEALAKAAPRPTPAPSPSPLPALQGDEYYATVQVAGVLGTLNVRSGPSGEDTKIGEIRNGSRLIVEYVTEDGWAKMKTAELNGFVSMAYIVPEE